jgi:hypothetical protein
MKQIDTCLDRFFNNLPPLKHKWQAIRKDNELHLYHYHHLILIASLPDLTIKYKWYECRTDKRGLDAALQYLENKLK